MTATTPLLTTPGTDLTSADAQKPERLKKAAHDFEALLIGEMLKAAHADSEDGWLGSGGSAGSDSAMQMAESQFAQALSSGKGLGLASVIERSMNRELGGNNSLTVAKH